MNCPKCGVQMPEGSKWCNQCGAQLEAQKPAQKPNKVECEILSGAGRLIAAAMIESLFYAIVIFFLIFFSTETYDDGVKTGCIVGIVLVVVALIVAVLKHRVKIAQTIRVETNTISGVGTKSFCATLPFSLEPSQVSRVSVKGAFLTIDSNIHSGVGTLNTIMLNLGKDNAAAAAKAIRKVCNL